MGMMIVKTKKMSTKEVKKKFHDFIDELADDCGPELEEMADSLKEHGDDFIDALSHGGNYRDGSGNYREASSGNGNYRTGRSSGVSSDSGPVSSSRNSSWPSSVA